MRQHAVNLVAHVLRRYVDILFQLEGDEDLRNAFRRDRPQLVDAVDGVDGLFDLIGNLGLDFLGRRAGLRVVTVTIGKSILGKRSTPSFE